MKKSLRSVMLLALMLMFTFEMFVPGAYAADTASANLPVEVKIEGDLSESDDSFVIEMVAADKTNPMPQGSENGVYSMTVSGGGKVSFPEIVYDKLGFYEYKIYQKAGENPNGTYDQSEYDVLVQVINAANMEDLEVIVAVYKVGSEFKQEIVFTNSYTSVPPVEPEPKPTPEPVDTGDQNYLEFYLFLSGYTLILLIAMYAFHRRAMRKSR